MLASKEGFESWLFSPDSFKDLYLSEDDSSGDEDEGCSRRARRSVKTKQDPSERYNSQFFLTYLSQEALERKVDDDTSHLGKKFRRRFRVPYCIFQDICTDIKLHGLHEEGKKDASGSEAVSIELLVLGSLRLVGSGCTFDAIEELTNVDEETHRVFFHDKFCAWGERAVERHIRMPSTDEEFRHILALYERIGLPGCGGSVDCVHLVWDKCPSGLTSACKGKDKIPTLAFEVSASHTKRILSVSQYFYGTINDKSISLSDAVFESYREEGGKHREYEWTSVENKTTTSSSASTTSSSNKRKNKEASYVKHKGLYMICDGGYHKWPCMIPPFKVQVPNTPEERWAKRLESARKDVERVFGILKKRFLILKHPIRIHDPCRIERIFKTCCVLHNILLDYDEFDNWNWGEEDVDVEYSILEESAQMRADRKRNGRGIAGTRSARRELYGIAEDDRVEDAVADAVSAALPAEEHDFHSRRHHLVAHYERMRNRRSVRIK